MKTEKKVRSKKLQWENGIIIGTAVFQDYKNKKKIEGRTSVGISRTPLKELADALLAITDALRRTKTMNDSGGFRYTGISGFRE